MSSELMTWYQVGSSQPVEAPMPFSDRMPRSGTSSTTYHDAAVQNGRRASEGGDVSLDMREFNDDKDKRRKEQGEGHDELFVDYLRDIRDLLRHQKLILRQREDEKCLTDGRQISVVLSGLAIFHATLIVAIMSFMDDMASNYNGTSDGVLLSTFLDEFVLSSVVALLLSLPAVIFSVHAAATFVPAWKEGLKKSRKIAGICLAGSLFADLVTLMFFATWFQALQMDGEHRQKWPGFVLKLVVLSTMAGLTATITQFFLRRLTPASKWVCIFINVVILLAFVVVFILAGSAWNLKS